MYQKLFFLSVILFLFTSQCSDNGVKPPYKDRFCEISDTTSHMVNWRVDTIGVFSSALYDVVAIDANNVWAVGEIELKEYPETDRHNAVKWNGSTYEYYKVSDGSGAPRLDVVLGFAENDIWMFGQDRYSFWNGDSFSHYKIPLGEAKGSTKAAWGTSSTDFYIVGNNGSISHYDGSTFSLMESNTDIDFFDINGYVDDETGEKHIWVLGSEDGVAVVLQYKDEQWINIWNMDLLGNYRFPHALYIPDDKSLIMSVWSGLDQIGGLYCFNQKDLDDNHLLAEYSTFVFGMAGKSLSDLFLTGSFNQTEHFNGKDFYMYSELFGDGRFYSVDIYDKNIFIVGRVDQLPLFAHGVK